jgi:signal transduction histidine kinase
MKERATHQLDSALELPSDLPVELMELAENFDTLLARVAAIRERERDFIRHAAHELRTPIAGLRATTDLALSQPRDAAAYAAHLATCQKTAIELGELVKRLSALSRIDQAAAPPLLEPIDIAKILAKRLDAFTPLFKKRSLQLKRDFPTGPMTVTGDLTLLNIILNNLLDNAVSYAAPESEVIIHGRITGKQVEIRIANLSENLPDNLERLFEPLFRRESSRRDAGAHLGIGLTLSLEAATAMRATLHARRPEAGWIEFVLRIDLAAPAEWI